MYLFPRLDPKMYPIDDDQQFILELLLEEKVLVVQGSGFNWPHPDHFRVVFLPNEDDLTEAIGRIARFLERYRKRHGIVIMIVSATKDTDMHGEKQRFHCGILPCTSVFIRGRI